MVNFAVELISSQYNVITYHFITASLHSLSLLRRGLLHDQRARPAEGHRISRIQSRQRQSPNYATHAKHFATLPAVALLTKLIEWRGTRGALHYIAKGLPVQRHRIDLLSQRVQVFRLLLGNLKGEFNLRFIFSLTVSNSTHRECGKGKVGRIY